MASPLQQGPTTVALDGAKLRVHVAGKGPPLIVQPPGWGIGCGPYKGAFAALERDFTVITYDPRGSGASTRTIDPATFDIDQLVRDLDGLRVGLGLEQFLLAGHSHGGLIALHYALRHPKRVSALLLIAAQLVGATPAPEPRPLLKELLTDARFREGYESFSRAGGFGAVGSMKSDKELSQFIQSIAPIYLRQTKHTPVLCDYFEKAAVPLRTLLAVSSHDGRFSVLPAATKLNVPTLLINGKYDLLCPAAGAKAFAEHAHATFRELDGSGHFPWLEQPEEFFSAARSFLSARARTKSPIGAARSEPFK